MFKSRARDQNSRIAFSATATLARAGLTSFSTSSGTYWNLDRERVQRVAVVIAVQSMAHLQRVLESADGPLFFMRGKL
jgi:hypothetical protein